MNKATPKLRNDLFRAQPFQTSLRKMIILVFASLVLTFVGGQALACDCAWQGPFVKLGKVGTVIHAEVLSYHGKTKFDTHLSMDVRVISTFRSDRQLPQTIRLWGDNGALCRPYVDRFPIGTRWILALGESRRQTEANGFAISICGEFWLSEEKGRVTGYITKSQRDGKPETMSLDRLRELLINNR
jgi:hypothetical protein